MRQFNPDTDCMVIVDNHHGRYIPSLFCEQFHDELVAVNLGLEADNIILTAKAEYPDADWQSHDDDWDLILGNYLHKYGNREWTLAYGPCGDLLLIANDVELPDDLFM